VIASDADDATQERVEATDDVARVLQAVAELRVTIVLATIEELSHKNIAAILGIC
jgi:DNA-directed RNA polymerase specialized sigma24 family protein